MTFPLRSLAGILVGLIGLCLGSVAATPALARPVAPSSRLAPAPDTVAIPGPLRPFLRMSGISQEVTPPEILPMLARNVFLHGFQTGRPTEFLILIDRYLRQARELQSIAGGGEIHVASCADALQLVRILGYRFEHGCSRTNASLITQDAERAFITVDSGFPITRLEEALEKGTAFSYPFPETPVPVLFSQNDWLVLSGWKHKSNGNLIDVLLHDEQVDRLYSAMSQVEPHTRDLLYHSPGLPRLLPLAAALDFYGSQICVPGHAVNVPGDELAEQSWEKIVGASPRSPTEFVLHLLSRDSGWLAAYFDALSRIAPEQQKHLVSGERLKQLYEAYRSGNSGVVASSGVFPRNASLMLLLSRLQWQPDGNLFIPGSLAVWQQAFSGRSHARGYRHAHSIDTPDNLLQALIASTGIDSDLGPAQAYLTIAAIDSGRPLSQRLSENTVRLLENQYPEYHAWYLTFADFPQLDDSAIAEFFTTADHVGAISNPALRANALGAFQADVGLWKIFARQREIPAGDLNASWHRTLQPFTAAENSVQIFDAARASLYTLVAAAGGGPNPTEDEIVNLLAGPPQNSPDGQRVREELADRIRSVLSDQRLASLDTLFGLYDGLDSMAHGADIGNSLLPLAASLHEFEMPRAIFTTGERVAWSPLIYTSRHAELQLQTDLTKLIRQDHSPQQLEAARGRLTPFLRDSLVGLNYAYYEPPGAQVLHNNPLFVRSHDFTVASVQGVQQVWDTPELIGIGATAGGGAYLMGSLASLPYALAAAEQDFISPEKVQALIWRETVPQLLVEGVLPRWWGISQAEMHAAALYQRAGEELLVAAQSQPDVREKVLDIFSERFTWERLQTLEERLDHPEDPNALIRQLLPADAFYLTAQFRARFPGHAAQWSPAARQLQDLARKNPAETSPERLASDFGSPHPTLTRSDECSLLDREPFPVSGGFASRLFAESWESSNLYWARLADEKGYPPVMLNVLVPELTQRMVANIFATYVDDWPALLRAMQETGAQFQQGKVSLDQAFSSQDKSESTGSGSE